MSMDHLSEVLSGLKPLSRLDRPLEMVRQFTPNWFAAVMAVSASAPAMAHHSFAMFDSQKNLTLDGVVKDFQWTNPHSWIQLTVKDPASGKAVEWSIEAGSPNSLSRNGWKHSSLKPGDKATLVIHPMKDGSPGGSLVNASANGVPIVAS